VSGSGLPLDRALPPPPTIGPYPEQSECREHATDALRRALPGGLDTAHGPLPRRNRRAAIAPLRDMMREAGDDQASKAVVPMGNVGIQSVILMRLHEYQAGTPAIAPTVMPRGSNELRALGADGPICRCRNVCYDWLDANDARTRG